MTITKNLVVPGVVAFAAVAGLAVGSSLNAIGANAATTSSTTTSSTLRQPSQPDPSKGGYIGANGKKEELLSGDTAEKVKAAALEAVPGGTIQRVETDAEGATYEAHMTKSDGSQVTVKLDANFKVTGTESGLGGGGPGRPDQQ